jgi:hypothetical protein
VIFSVVKELEDGIVDLTVNVGISCCSSSVLFTLQFWLRYAQTHETLNIVSKRSLLSQSSRPIFSFFICRLCDRSSCLEDDGVVRKLKRAP